MTAVPRAARAILCSAALLLAPLVAGAQDSGAAPVWISHPEVRNTPSGVLHFRQHAALAGKPDALWVRVSADNRFVLYVNGQRVVRGPATSDLAHWRYKRVDIAPYLHAGDNDIAAVVWNFSVPSGPMSQISARTGFYFQAEAGEHSGLNSGPQWQVKLDRGHKSASGMGQINKQFKGLYYVASAPEIIDAASADWNWTTGPVQAADGWTAAVPALDPGRPAPWTLTADPLPDMAYRKIGSGKVVRADLPDAARFPQAALVIPANTRTRILLDQGAMVAAFPRLSVAGGKGAVIKMTYAEALYDKDGKKGKRDEVGTREIKGIHDLLTADGGERVFEPLHWRVWRFVELDIETRDAPLTLRDLETYETGYPFEQAGKFVSDDAELNQIWSIGWRTARIDAHETYMDSSYWEQLQYVGDTRLQALISYAVAGDNRLAVNAIDTIGWSDRQGGLTEGAYPSRGRNVIAPFSLLWIAMLDDYYQRYPDTAVVVRNLPRARAVMAWYEKYLRPSNLLGKNPTWNFVDWVGMAREQFPSFDGNGESCLTTLFYLGALQQMAGLERALGDPAQGATAAARAAQISNALRAQCWSEERHLYADDPSLTKFSQHTNALAILYDVATRAQADTIIRHITTDQGITAPSEVIQASYYFAWYVGRALAHVGHGDAYLELMQTWRGLLALNFSTWPEEGGDTRSDTHAWTGHPTADLLEIVAGIRPDAPGYARARIAPSLGRLKRLDATAQTPSGPVSVSYRRAKGKLRAEISKPPGLGAVFSWRGKEYALKQEHTVLTVADPD
ncbi:alpha-L-rhamnosidase C-terminal domain-containing protein [Oxalobacteraceae bacterium A2-2]